MSHPDEPVGQPPQAGVTVRALRAWRRQPQLLAGWMMLSVGIAVVLLAGALLVAQMAPGDQPFVPVFADQTSGVPEAAWLLQHNLLVLALHSLVCVACFLAQRTGRGDNDEVSLLGRQLHRRTRDVALAAVAACTVFSLTMQTVTLGVDLADAAAGLGVRPGQLLARLAPHAIVELTAMFLPLAACLQLTRQRRGDDLLAAALICTAAAVPMLLAGATWEVWAAPHLIAGV